MTEYAAAIIIRRLDVLQHILAVFDPWPNDLVLITPTMVSRHYGIGWAIQMQALIPPHIPFIIDVDDLAGDALVALRQGARHVLCMADDAQARRLKAIFDAEGAVLGNIRPPCFDPPLTNLRPAGLKRLMDLAKAWYATHHHVPS